MTAMRRPRNSAALLLWRWRWQLSRLTRPVWVRVAFVFAWLWRRMLWRTQFVAVTGSSGKTYTKDLIAAALSSRFRVLATKGSFSNSAGLVLTVLRARPWHDVVVVETALGSRWSMAAQASLVRPDVAVILNARELHLDEFGSVAEVARQKALLFDGLTATGVGIFNIDCEFSRAALAEKSARLTGFGYSPDAQTRIIDVASALPERLQLQVQVSDQTVSLSCRCVGVHWATGIAAALAVAHECGVPAREAAGKIAAVEPNWGRMRPVTLSDPDITIIRDERNGGKATFAAAFAVLRSAQGGRRIAVLGAYSEAEEDGREVCAKWLAKHARDSTDILLFVGEIATAGEEAALQAGMPAGQVLGFADATAAGQWLRENCQSGDFVLLKGRRRDHLSRAYLAQLGDVGCHLEQCDLPHICDQCRWLGFGYADGREGYMCPPGISL